MAQQRRRSPDRRTNRHAVRHKRPDERRPDPTRRKRNPDTRQGRNLSRPNERQGREPNGPDAQERERRKRQAAKKQALKRKKQKRRRKILKRVLIVLVVLVLFAGLVYLSTLVFRLKQIKVTKNQYTVSEDVVEWIKQDPYSENTLYVWWKYNRTEPAALPAAKSIRVKLTSPWEVTVEVEEKTFIGRMDLNGEFLYFDENGIASYQSTEVIEGVALVEGAQIQEEEIQLGKELPVSDQAVFENLCTIVDLLKQNELEPDKIGFEKTNITLWFGGVQIAVGSRDYETKLEQIPPVLAKLTELYPGQNGVLHLENYEQGTDSIRFVPEQAQQQEE